MTETETWTLEKRILFEAEFGAIEIENYSRLDYKEFLRERYIAMTTRKTKCCTCLLRWDCMERKQYQDLACGSYIYD